MLPVGCLALRLPTRAKQSLTELLMKRLSRPTVDRLLSESRQGNRITPHELRQRLPQQNRHKADMNGVVDRVQFCS